MSIILLTGFEPFGGEAVNPSWQIAQGLEGEVLSGARVVALQLPCVFEDSLRVLRHALKVHAPTWVLSLGQAGGRTDLTPERIAINVNDARIPDNAGGQPIDTPVVPGAPAARFSTLPIKAMVAAIQAAGLRASVSQTAGTFVCNHVFYGLMHAVRRRPGVRAGFMHVPLVPEQAAARAGLPSMPLADMQRGVRVALMAALTVARDLQVSGGAES
jgi:pyroglutamyl-peptidase